MKNNKVLVGGIIVAIIALAIGGFYWLTKDQEPEQGAVIPGQQLSYTLVKAENPIGITIHLFHQLDGQKEDWNPYLEQLGAAGFNVIAIDFRGHGNYSDDWHDYSTNDWQGLIDDVVSSGLVGQTIFQQDEQWFIGSSLGSLAAWNGAVKTARIPDGVVLLSPSLEYQGISADFPNSAYIGPVLFVSSPADAESYSDTLELILETMADPNKLIEPASGHGYEMLESDEDLMDQIIEFILANKKDA